MHGFDIQGYVLPINLVDDRPIGLLHYMRIDLFPSQFKYSFTSATAVMASFSDSSSQDLDRWIDKLLSCKALSEIELISLCDQVNSGNSNF